MASPGYLTPFTIVLLSSVFPHPIHPHISTGVAADEPAFMPQQALTVDTGKQPILRIASASHLFSGYISPLPLPATLSLPMDDADSLRSLPCLTEIAAVYSSQDGRLQAVKTGERFCLAHGGYPIRGQCGNGDIMPQPLLAVANSMTRIFLKTLLILSLISLN